MDDLLSVLLFAARVAIYAAVGYFVIKAAVKAASGSTKKRKKSRTILKLKKLKSHPLCRAFPPLHSGPFV